MCLVCGWKLSGAGVGKVCPNLADAQVKRNFIKERCFPLHDFRVLMSRDLHFHDFMLFLVGNAC